MITIVVGTNRPKAKSKEIAIYYQQLLNELGAKSQILDLENLPADFTISALYGNKNSDFETLKIKMREAEKYVFIVPEYNGSFPGILKTFIDGLSYPNEILHKKAALVGISDGVQGGALALSHLNDIFNYLGLNTLAQRVKIPFLKKNFVNGEITDPLISQLMKDQAKLLVAF